MDQYKLTVTKPGKPGPVYEETFDKDNEPTIKIRPCDGALKKKIYRDSEMLSMVHFKVEPPYTITVEEDIKAQHVVERPVAPPAPESH